MPSSQQPDPTGSRTTGSQTQTTESSLQGESTGLERPRERSPRRESEGGLERRGGERGLWSSSPFLGLSPFSLVRRMMEDMDRLFEGPTMGRGREWPSMFGGEPFAGRSLTTFSPSVDIFEQEGALKIQVDVPGVPESGLSVEATEDGLIVRGERRMEEEETRGGVYRSERAVGRFERFIPLPEDADIEAAQADLREGVLEITVPLPETRRSRGRRIEIRSSGSALGAGQPEEGSAKIH